MLKGRKGLTKWKLLLGITNHLAFQHHSSDVGILLKQTVLNSDSAEDLWKKQMSSLISLCYSMHRKLWIIFYIIKVIDLEKLLAENLMY